MSSQKYKQLITSYRRNSALMCAVGSRVRSERLAMGWTQREVAEKLGIKQPNLAAMEKGRVSPTIEVLEAVCGWRGRTLEWLLFGEEGADSLVAEGAEAYGRVPLRLPVAAETCQEADQRIAWREVEPVDWCEVPSNARLLAVRGDGLRPLASDGQKLLAVEAPAADGDLVAVEMRDGRRLVKRWWAGKRGKVTLQGARQSSSVPPVVERRGDIRRVWRIIGVLL